MDDADPTGVEPAHLSLAARLSARLPEIERAIGARVDSVADPAEVGDPAYTEGLRSAIAAALDYAIAGIEADDPEPGPVPAELFAQARAAARARVPLDTVLRRYLAGHALIADFAMREADAAESVSASEVQRALRTLAALVDRLIAAVSEQYRREAEQRPRTPGRRRAELVRRLLAGEQADAAELAYDLEGWHLALVAAGPEVESRLRELARALDRRPLVVRQECGVVWAWLGSVRPAPAENVLEALTAAMPPGAVAAIGEPAAKLTGWSLTHRQALAALPVARRGPEPVVRYADVALLAAALRDDLLTASVRRLYLEPLERERDGGTILRETLRAYFATERNVSSAAMALGVNRNTVTARLRTVEQRLARPFGACSAELEVALRLAELVEPKAPKPALTGHSARLSASPLRTLPGCSGQDS
ncbi:MAG TPA: helix-turn-helix domain-containing protein [Solirubrobacterales bacterium]|nr:helix-turn-helix domain-containing protein [Solirubrobacterales bacterium]